MHVNIWHLAARETKVCCFGGKLENKNSSLAIFVFKCDFLFIVYTVFARSLCLFCRTRIYPNPRVVLLIA
jgi:hypothetical protein